MKPTISVLVPVYNTEHTLRKCLASILAQTFTDWELIAVNDCSPDGSAKILDRFARRDPRIRVVTHPVNRGVSQARFTGLEHASGRYIVFVDSDDWMHKNALRALYDKIESTGADMVIGSMVKVVDKYLIFRSKPNNVSSPELRTASITPPELMDKYFINYLGINMFSPNMWGRIYRRAAIDRAIESGLLRPVEFFNGEDVAFNLILHPFLTEIGFVPDTVYYYRVGGATSTSTPRMLDAVKQQFRLKEEQIRRYNYHKATPHIKRELIDSFFYHFRNLVLLDGVGYDEVAKRIAGELTDTIYGAELFEGVPPSEWTTALQTRNVDTMMEIIRREVKRIAPRHRLVKILSRLLP
ncbi:MAG: glycosyltransferase [Alistipes sp.]|jgi:glycosyltransferase involved in cell wall biosynthesis|nr:glycosyltransferase [Alistipes sp.]